MSMHKEDRNVKVCDISPEIFKTMLYAQSLMYQPSEEEINQIARIDHHRNPYSHPKPNLRTREQIIAQLQVKRANALFLEVISPLDEMNRRSKK